jgi:nucleoside-diphosphate-sugar epimerase
MSVKKVLITGVYGLIGGAVYKRLCAQPESYETYGLARRRHPSVSVPTEWDVEVPESRFFESDLSSLEQVTEAVQGMDVVVHMAADPSGSAGWESLLASNIIGAYHVFEACRLAGVGRIVFASSNMVSFGYMDTDAGAGDHR